MELVLNNKFIEMNEQEMMDVDGGIIITAMVIGAAIGWKAAATATKATILVKVASAGGGAVVGGEIGKNIQAAADRPNNRWSPFVRGVVNNLP